MEESWAGSIPDARAMNTLQAVEQAIASVELALEQLAKSEPQTRPMRVAKILLTGALDHLGAARLQLKLKH